MSQNVSVSTPRLSTPRPLPTRPPRWQLGLALLAFLAASFFGARAGADFERWVVTGLWIAVGLIWIVLWRMDVKKYERAVKRALNPTPTQPPVD